MKQAPFTAKRWGRVEYDRLVDLGVFEDEPLELIGGQLIVAEPKVSSLRSACRQHRSPSPRCCPSVRRYTAGMPLGVLDSTTRLISVTVPDPPGARR